MAAAMATAAVLCGTTFTACGGEDKRAMTEEEWKTAFEATCSSTSYTAEFVHKSGNATDISKEDYESGNYETEPPETLITSTTKYSNLLKIYYSEVNDRQEIGVCKSNYLYTITAYHNKDWLIRSEEFESAESLNKHYEETYSLNQIFTTSGLNGLSQYYKKFEYDAETDSYSGTILSTELDSQVYPSELNVTLKFADGKISQFSYDSIIAEEGATGTMSAYRIQTTIKFSQLNTTEVFSQEDLQKINAAIENYKED